MVKYFKIAFGGDDYIIPVDGIINVQVSANAVAISYSEVTLTGATPEVLQASLPSTGMSVAEQTAQKSAVIEAIAEALSTAWTKPFYELSLPSALTSAPSLTSGVL